MTLMMFSYTVNTMPPLSYNTHQRRQPQTTTRSYRTHHQPREPRSRARPEAAQALLGVDPIRAVERVLVRLPRL